MVLFQHMWYGKLILIASIVGKFSEAATSGTGTKTTPVWSRERAVAPRECNRKRSQPPPCYGHSPAAGHGPRYPSPRAPGLPATDASPNKWLRFRRSPVATAAQKPSPPNPASTSSSWRSGYPSLVRRWPPQPPHPSWHVAFVFLNFNLDADSRKYQ